MLTATPKYGFIFFKFDHFGSHIGRLVCAITKRLFVAFATSTPSIVFICLNESLKIIFSEFRQASEGYNRAYEGVGLGLTISKKIIDLMQVWKGISFATESLAEVCYMLGIPSPKDDIKGNEVSSKYYAGEMERIVVYNKKDVVSTARVFVKLFNLDLDFEVVETTKKETLNTYKSVLDEAVITKVLDITKIDEKVSSTKLTKKEKEVVTSLIETVKGYVES